MPGFDSPITQIKKCAPGMRGLRKQSDQFENFTVVKYEKIFITCFYWLFSTKETN